MPCLRNLLEKSWLGTIVFEWCCTASLDFNALFFFLTVLFCCCFLLSVIIITSNAKIIYKKINMIQADIYINNIYMINNFVVQPKDKSLPCPFLRPQFDQIQNGSSYSGLWYFSHRIFSVFTVLNSKQLLLVQWSRGKERGRVSLFRLQTIIRTAINS